MAQICYKPAGSCNTCKHYKYDEDLGRKACFEPEPSKESATIRELMWLKENRPDEYEALLRQMPKKGA